MGPVHLYLAAWVAGGVLLGGSMLLEGREGGSSEAIRGSEQPPVEPYALVSGQTAVKTGPRRGSFFARILRLMPLGLIGFGLYGLTAKGLNLDLWPGTLNCAFGVGLSLIAAGYGLSRTCSLR